MTTYYDVLGVDEQATKEEINEKYQDRVKEFHPDGSSAHPYKTKLFQDVKQAKEGLIGDGSRKIKPCGQSGSLHFVWVNGVPIKPNPEQTTTADSDPVHTTSQKTTEASSNQSHTTSEKTTTADSSSGDRKSAKSREKASWNKSEENFANSTTRSPGKETNQSKDNKETSLFTRRNIAIGGLLAIGSTFVGGPPSSISSSIGFGTDNNGSGDSSEDKPDTVTVNPSDSIQNAIDKVSPGGVVKLEAGTYYEKLSITQDLKLEAPNGATLSGANGEDDFGIGVSDAAVEIENVDITTFEGRAVFSQGDSSEIVLKDSEITEIDGKGLEVEGGRIKIVDCEITDCDDTAVRIESPPDGKVDVENTTIARSTRRTANFADIMGHGLLIVGAKDITISKVQSVDNGGNNILIKEGDSHNQQIEITETLASSSENENNIAIEGTSGDDTVVIKDVESSNSDVAGANIGYEFEIATLRIEESSFTDNSRKGLRCAGESVVIKQVEAMDNGDTGVRIDVSPEGVVDVRDTLIERSTRDTFNFSERWGHGLAVVGGTEIDIIDTDSLDNGGSNFKIRQGDSRNQMVTIEDSSALNSEQKSNIEIEGTDGDSTVKIGKVKANNASECGMKVGYESEITNIEIENAEIKDSGEKGLQLGAREVVLQTVEIQDSGDTGIRVDSSSEGEVCVEDSVIKRSNRTTFNFQTIMGHGLAVTGATDISISNLESVDNEGNNIRIYEDGARDRSITISDSTVNSAGEGSGIVVESTPGSDEASIQSVETNSNPEFGLDIGGKSVTIEETTAEENQQGPYNFRDAKEEDITIRNSTRE